MFSYWERVSLLQYDHIIIGGGLVGLNTAIELREKSPQSRILVLERSLLSFGASTRNAGFACMGSLTELLDDLQQLTEDNMLTLFSQRFRGLLRLRNRLGDETIGYQANGSYEIISEQELPSLHHLDRINEILQPVCGKKAFSIVQKQTDFGFAPHWARTMIENTCEGELHTGKLMQALTAYCLQLGIEIKTGAYVSSFQDENLYVTVSIDDPVRGAHIDLVARSLFICTNAFTASLLPAASLSPGRGQVLITRPIPDLNIKGIFHFDKGYYYFREIDGRVLFGGGRQLDFIGEKTTSIEIQDQIQADLEYKLQHFILPGKRFEIDMRWAGIMAFGSSRMPVIEHYSERVFTAYRMGGMGVALATVVAEEVVSLAAMHI